MYAIYPGRVNRVRWFVACANAALLSLIGATILVFSANMPAMGSLLKRRGRRRHNSRSGGPSSSRSRRYHYRCCGWKGRWGQWPLSRVRAHIGSRHVAIEADPVTKSPPRTTAAAAAMTLTASPQGAPTHERWWRAGDGCVLLWMHRWEAMPW